MFVVEGDVIMLLLDEAVSAIEFCTDTAAVWQLVGRVLFVFKIVIPILLMVFGMIDLGKAVVGAKDDEIKKALKQLMMRAIAAVVIFLIPTIVAFIFSIVDSFSDVKTDYNVCATCISHPGKCNTGQINDGIVK